MVNLILTMDSDNGGTSLISRCQLEKGAEAIQKMMDSGTAFPPTDRAAAAAMRNLESIYWRIAAGETSETMEEFKDVPGFTELFCILSDIFLGESDAHPGN